MRRVLLDLKAIISHGLSNYILQDQQILYKSTLKEPEI